MRKKVSFLVRSCLIYVRQALWVGTFVRMKAKKTRMWERSAILAFYFLLAVPSFASCLFTVFSWISPVSKTLNEEILYLIQVVSPDENTYENLRVMFGELSVKMAKASLSLRLLLTFFFASNVIAVIHKSFTRSLKEKVSPLRRRVNAFKGTVILMFLVFSGLFVLLALKSFMSNLFVQWQGAVREYSLATVYQFLQVIVISLLLLASSAYIYKYLHPGTKKTPFFSKGAVVVTVVALLLLYIFSYWVNHYVPYNLIFGSLGTLVIVLLLFQFFAFLLLLGFEINLGISALEEKKNLPKKNKKYKKI